MHRFLQRELIGFLLRKFFIIIEVEGRSGRVGELDIGGRSGHGQRVDPHSGVHSELVSASSLVVAGRARLSWDLSQRKTCSKIFKRRQGWGKKPTEIEKIGVSFSPSSPLSHPLFSFLKL